MAVVLYASSELLLQLGAKPVPRDMNGKPLPLVPKRPTILAQCPVSQEFYYWEVVSGVLDAADPLPPR